MKYILKNPDVDAIQIGRYTVDELREFIWRCNTKRDEVSSIRCEAIVDLSQTSIYVPKVYLRSDGCTTEVEESDWIVRGITCDEYGPKIMVLSDTEFNTCFKEADE